MSENNVAYKEENGVLSVNMKWSFGALPSSSPSEVSAAPGLLERETKYLSKGAKLYENSKWSSVGSPTVDMRDEAVRVLDEIDDFALEASTVVRVQVMRSKSGCLKTVPFQPLKDLSGAQYAQTLARFFAFARIFYDNETKTCKELVQVPQTQTRKHLYTLTHVT
jgi:hypothetical protein